MTAAAPRMDKETLRYPVFEVSLLVMVGGFGSGKSEVAVNLARHLSTLPGNPVAIADLDIINPYFRSREAAATLEQLGIRSLVPPGAQQYADLPIIIPEIKAAIEQRQFRLVLDVGGDDLGARVLSSLENAFHTAPFELLLVHNARRPFTSDVDGTLKVIAEIEAASRFKVTGLVSNTHLAAETTAEIVVEGVRLAGQVAKQKGIPLVFVSALNNLCEEIDRQLKSTFPILPLDRELLKPWESHTQTPNSMTRKRGA